MNEVILPPAPNWYLSSIFICANDGTVAWGSKNAIVVAKNFDRHKSIDYSIISNAHLDKVNSLAFSPEYGHPSKNLLLSGGDEHIIRIWDLDTMTAILSQSYLDPKQKVIDVDWSKADPTLVCSISIEGLLISWNITFSVCQTIPLGKMTATCIACCPHKSNIVAVGTKSGLVHIINLHGSGNIVYRMRGHDIDITCLSWCPSDTNVFNESINKDLLLASGAKDRSIFIWRAGSDGRYEIQLKLPNSPQDFQSHKPKLGSSACNFTVISWLQPKCLLVSSAYGEVLSIDLSQSMKKPLWKFIHGNHARSIFSIATVSENLKSSNRNWRSDDEFKVWTTAQDRQVICSAIRNGKCNIEYSAPTHAGYIYSIVPCPLDTSRIAYGGGDALLRLWNLSEPHKDIFNITSLWQKIMGKIITIAWHPQQENILALGTREGRIGIYDTNNMNKPPILCRQHHRRTVYSLGWGPDPSNKHFDLYSCGDYELVYYQHDKLTMAPTVFMKKDCTEFSWKPDFSCMAIGFEDGSLSFVNQKLQTCGRPIFYLKKAVQCLVWHPDSTQTDLKYSSLRHYLAVATNSNSIAIFDMTMLMNHMVNESLKESSNDQNEINDPHNIDLNEEDKTVQHKIVGILTGHIDRVVCLAWSPHFSGHLVSGSFDNTAQVWNINTQELIGTYIGHSGPIYSCMWSPLHPDFIVTGSADFSLRIWRLSQQKVIIPNEKLEPKKNKSKKFKKKIERTITTNNIANVSLLNGDDINDSSCLAPNIDDEPIKQVLKESCSREKKTKNKKGSFFSAYNKIMNDKEVVLASCVKLAKKVLRHYDDESNSADNEDILTIFGTKEDVSKILNIEQIALDVQGQHMMATEISVWNNNLRQKLHDAAKEWRLNDFLVSLAPSLSVKMWHTMCETYASQLIKESNPTKAVCYLLCIHKIHRAIEVFMESKMYKEAFVLAKCKLESDDIVLNNILEEWIKASLKMGQFEDAAQCYIQLGDLSGAAKVLSRRKDILTLETAVELAILADNQELSESILDQTMIELFVHFNIEKCRSLIRKFPIIHHRLIHIETAEELIKIREISDDSRVLSWLEDKSEYGLLPTLRERHRELNTSIYKKLAVLTNANYLENKSMLWMMMSQEMALAVISPTNEKKLYHIVSTLEMLSKHEILYPIKSVQSHIGTNFSINLIASLDAKNFSMSSILENETNPMYKSLRAYMCLALLNWLLDKMKKTINAEFPLNSIMNIIKKTLVDSLDRKTVRYWTFTNEISKLEAAFASSLRNTQKKDEDKESIENSTVLLKRLETIHTDKKDFLAERVAAPSPILIYSKATELSSILTDVNMKNNFDKLVNDTWRLTVS